MAVGPISGLWLPPGVDMGGYQPGLPFGSPNPYGAPSPTPAMPTGPTTPAPAPAPAPTPTPQPTTSPISDAARQAATAQTRTAGPVRPSVLREGLRTGSMPPGPVGPNPPPNLPPASQGVRGTGGAGMALEGAAAQARAVASGRVPGTSGGGGGFSAPGITNPGTNFLSNPPPPGIRSTSLSGPQGPGGLKGGLTNMVVGGTILAGMNQLNQTRDFNNPLGRVLNATGRGAGGGTIVGGPMAGTIAGVGSGLMQGDVEARRWAAEQGLPAQAGVGFAESAAQMGGPIGQAAVFGGQIADSLGLSEPLADYAGRVEDAGIPLVSGFAGMFSGGGLSEEEQAQAQAEAAAAQQRQAQLVDPTYMSQTFERVGLPPEAAADAVARYEDAVTRSLVMNEVGQYGVLRDGDGNLYTPNPDTGEWSTEDGSTKSVDELSRLSEDEIRAITAQEMYASIPELLASEQQRVAQMTRAAAFQAMMAGQIDPLLARSEDTAAAFEAAGDPVGAAYARDAATSRAAMLQALPMIQAIDEQQQWDQRMAQLQEQAMINQIQQQLYGGQGGGDGQTLEDVTSGG